MNPVKTPTPRQLSLQAGLAIFKLQFKTILRNPSTLFTIIIISLIMIIYGTTSTPETIPKVFAQTITIVIFDICLTWFGANFMELRKSVIMKRIGATSISKKVTLFTFSIYAFLMGIISIIIIFLIGLIFGVAGWIPVINWALFNWGGIIIGIIISLITTIIITFFIISISKNFNMYMIFNGAYFILVLFMGGLIVSTDSNWLQYVGYFIPNIYSSNLIETSIYGGDVFNLDGFFYSVIGTEIKGSVESWQAALNIFMPIIFAVLLTPITIKKFKWEI